MDRTQPQPQESMENNDVYEQIDERENGDYRFLVTAYPICFVTDLKKLVKKIHLRVF